MENIEENTKTCKSKEDEENKRNIAALTLCLESSSYEQAVELIHSKDYKIWMANSSWDLIPVVTKYLTSEIQLKNPRLIVCCQEILNEIARVSMPEEAFLEFLDKMDGEENDILLLSMLKPVDIILNRLQPSKRVQSLEWCLNSLQESISLCIDFSDEKRVVYVFSKIEEFYTRYVKEVTLLRDQVILLKDQDVDSLEREREVLACFLLQLLGQLAATSPPHPLADTLVHSLAELLPSLGQPLLYFMQNRVLSKDERHHAHFLDKNVPDQAFQMLYYMIVHHGVSPHSFPSVYSPQLLFSLGTALSCGLLESDQDSIQDKGLVLLSDVLGHVSPEDIPHHALASPYHARIFQAISKIMVFNASKSQRQASTSLLQKYILAFDPKGRHLFIKNAIIISEHSGIIGYLITQIKEFSLQYIHMNNNYFINNLTQLLCLVCKLSKGKNTLLFDESDKIISTLNLIRFLMLKDCKPGNLGTGIWTVESYIRDNFIEPLSQALLTSREYLQGQLYDAQCLDAKEKNKFDMMNVNVGGQLLPVPKYEEEVRGVQAKSTTLDFISFLLDIVKESF